MVLLKITWRTLWELNHWPQVKSLWCVSRPGWLKEPLASLLHNLFILGGTQTPRGDPWITWLPSYPSLQTRTQTEAASGMATKAHVRKKRACRSQTSLIDGLREWKRWKKKVKRRERKMWKLSNLPHKTSPPSKCTLKTHDVFFRVHLLLFSSPYK